MVISLTNFCLDYLLKSLHRVADWSTKKQPKRTRRDQSGLTLIEVLIALAIAGIAMTAVIKATSQNILATHHLENKTIALWVGKEVISEIQTELLVLHEGDPVKRTTTMFNKDWTWKAYQVNTPNKRIKKILVQVYENDNEDAEPNPIITLESYRYIRSVSV